MSARPVRASAPEVVALRRPTTAITRTIRRRPVPHGPVQGTLALEWVLPTGAEAQQSAAPNSGGFWKFVRQLFGLGG